MNNIVLTWASNFSERLNEYLVFFKSAQKLGLNVVCLTDSASAEAAKVFNCRIEVIDLKMDVINRDRFLAFWHFLVKNKYDRVLIADSRDILFQSNPFDYFMDKSLVLSREGFTHIESQWNMNDQFTNQRSLPAHEDNFISWPVVNGGVVMGSYEQVKSFCLAVWSTTIKSHCTDQGIINYLYNYCLKHDEAVHLSDPKEDTFVVTGEGIQRVDHVWNGKICLHGTPYAIFHQFDRTIYNKNILSEFND